MKLNILISCMNEDPNSLIKNSNIYTDSVIIDQCDETKEELMQINNSAIKYVMTKERGLSNSRNMALETCDSDVCLVSDDDEVFVNNLESVVLDAYKSIKDADIIIFEIKNYKKSIKSKMHRMKRFELLKVSSWQISFKRKSIIDNKIFFDSNIGSGTGNGGGEEIKFLLDCHRKGLKIYYVPKIICEVNHTESQWFFGYNKNYFFQRGATTSYYMGKFLAFIYGIYFVLTKRKLYIDEISSKNAMLEIIHGIKTGISIIGDQDGKK